ncbi:MAG TPA: protease pro-enzyme activation domain-containing protein, partial [Alphaproteobacteria bacterium]|nr:protease pro-enzyme activation domain-containing protein [Alphaproteobacteria bacterium]
MKRKSTRLFAGTVLFFGLTLPALADEQTLSGHVPAVVAAGLRPVGLLPATNVLHLSLELPPRNRDALVGLVGQIYDPKSTNFHSYLTPQQFTERFGPTVQDYEALENFAQSNHFTVESTFSNRTLLAVSGHVADINAAFRITLRTYRHPVENREFYAPDAEPKVDSRLPAFRINGLDNYVLPHPMGLFRTPANRTSGNTSSAGSAPGGGNFWGYDYRNAYVPGSNLTGAGQTVALFEDDGFYLTDITNYEISSGLPEVIPTVILVSSATGIPSTNGNAVGEVSLDIESVISMAPGLANLLVYEGNDDASMLTQMAQDDRAQQISSSWNIPRAST